VDGNNNTAFGTLALLTNVSGDNNTALGYEAGKSTTGTGNIFMGYQAGANANVSNKLYIDNSNIATPLVYGDFFNDFVTFYGNTGLGTQDFGGGTRVLAFYDGTSPSASITNGVLLYSSSTFLPPAPSELRVRDEAGNVTTLSPHNFTYIKKSEPMAWSFYSENAESGQNINVDMLRAVRLIEELSGEKLVFIHDFQGNSILNVNSEKKSISYKSLQSRIILLEEETDTYKKEIETLKKQIQELKTLINKN